MSVILFTLFVQLLLACIFVLMKSCPYKFSFTKRGIPEDYKYDVKLLFKVIAIQIEIYLMIGAFYFA